MKLKITYLLLCMLMACAFIKCSRSSTQATNQINKNKKPTLIAPKANSKQPSVLTLQWGPVKSAESYRVKLSQSSNFRFTLVDSVITSNHLRLKGLPSDTTLHWKVHPIVEGQPTQWSASWSFKTTAVSKSVSVAGTLLSAPEQLAPVNYEKKTSVQPLFKWTETKDAEKYLLHVSKGDEMIIEQEISDTSYVPQTALDIQATYYWRVKALNGAWSAIQSFTTTDDPVEPLAAPEQSAPGNEQTDVGLLPTFNWNDLPKADAYILHVSHSDVMDIKKQVSASQFTPESALSANTTYYWRVRAAKGEWSNINSFTTTDSPSEILAPPSLLKPADNVDDVLLTPTFSWEAAENAEAYVALILRGDEVVIKKEIPGTAFTLDSNLKDDASYKWKVRSLSESSQSSWSAANSFTTDGIPDNPPVAPEQVSPGNGAEGVVLQPSFKWESVADADAYELHVSYGDQMLVEQKVESSGFTPEQKFPAEATLYWRLRAIDSGVEGQWSEIYEFTTKAAESTDPVVPPVELSSPAEGATVASEVTLQWQQLSGIDSYRVQVSPADDFSNLVTDASAASTSYEVTGLDGGRSYYWRVQAGGDGQPGNWSQTRSFRTEASAPDGGDVDASTQRAVLMELYEATGGPQWANNSGWGEGAPSGSWYGLQVNAEGQVTRIDLYKNNLSGQLPESLGKLQHVHYLNLKGNHLHGRIPASLGDMQSLQTLILSGRTYQIGGNVKEPPQNLNYGYHPGKYSSSSNRFSGTIPSSLGELSGLEFLEISDQPDITGPIPSELGNLSNLKGLYLNMLDLDGYQIPDSFSQLRQLRHLYIAGSDVVGSLPDLSGLTELRWITITSSETLGRGLTGSLPDMRNMHKLRGLFLNNNELSGEYPSYFNNGNFPELHTIGFSWNNLKGTLHGFNNLPALESLTLSGNELSGTIGEQLLQLPERVQIVSLGWNNFSGELPQSGWPDFWQLKTLYLNDNGLTGSISCEFWNKLENPKLIFAWLKNNNFTGNCTSAMNAVQGEGDRLSITVDGNAF